MLKFPVPVTKAEILHDALQFLVAFGVAFGGQLADHGAAGWSALIAAAAAAAVVAAKQILRTVLPGKP